MDAELFPALDGVAYECDPKAQLMWLSDVRYLDAAGLEAFGRSPAPEVRAQILADIDLIVDKSTTYLVIGENGRTYADRTGDPAPQGPTRSPTFSLFFRKRGEEADFRALMKELSDRWSKAPGVMRLRLNLFETPDMEAERKAGYPVKTHPVEQQYQAWIDLTMETREAASALIAPADAKALAGSIAEIHTYPTRVVYTSNYAGRPTLVGLRGYPAYEAIQALGADHQRDQGLLSWMYGKVARDAAAA